MTPDRMSPETPAPMVELDQIKKLLGVPLETTTFDEQIQFSIDVVSGMIRTYTARYLMRDTYKDEFSPPQFMQRDGLFLSLWEFPIKTIVAVEVDGVAQGSPRHRIRRDYGLYLPVGLSPCGVVAVEYEAGYTTLPSDLLSVMIDLIRRQLAALGVDLSSVSNTVPDSAPIRAVNIGQLRVEYAMGVTSSNATVAIMSPLSDAVLSEYEHVLRLYRHPNMLAATGT